MKLLASDYDDTFYVSEEGIKENIEKVKEFKKDNIFLIATGRSYEEFMDKDNIYHIPYDYLIINHGTTIVKDGKVIYSKYIDYSILEELLRDLNVDTAKYYNISNEIEMDNHELTPYTNKVRVKYYDKEYAKEKCNFITNKYGKYVTSHYVSKGYALEIVNNNVDKSIAIEYVRNLEGINKKDVYTVGDGVTDKLMLTTFNGFKMENSCLEIEKLDISKVSSVSELIDIMGS